MFKNESKIKGCILGGAIGDAFGAPLEGLRNLSEIKEKFGPNGMQEFSFYKSFWDDSEEQGIGIITDDTTMLACTLSGIIEADDNNLDKLIDKQWQYYLVWGAVQNNGERIPQFIRTDTLTPDYLKPFIRRTGAGKNTIEALSKGICGNLDHPLEYEFTKNGKTEIIRNAGCGGQMRIAPVAFLYDDVNLIEFASRNAAITHGHEDAINATAITAELVKNCLVKENLSEAFYATKRDIMKLPGNKNILQAWNNAEHALFCDYEPGIDLMDKLGLSMGNNAFLALPVLSQTVYCIGEAKKIKNPTPDDFKKITRLAANHSGDSDSIAAIVGNCLGASWGEESLPKDWLDQIQLKDELIVLTDAYLQKANGIKPV